MANREHRESWDGFRYFLAVARSGTLSAAAIQLDTEHTTVSRRIRGLESEVGEPLFHRSNLGYQLTAAGRRLKAAAEAVEGAVLNAKAEAVGEQRVSGTVRVGATDGFGSVFLAPRLGKLARRHPDLAVEIFAAPRLFSLTRREADLVIALSAPKQARLVSRRLTDFSLYVHASKGYIEGAIPICRVEDLRSHPLIGYVEDSLFVPEIDYLSALGPDARAKVRSSGLIAQAFAAIGDGGLCILPGYFGAMFPTLTRVLPESISLRRSFHLHVHEDHRNAAAVRTVATFIAEEVKSSASLFE